MKTETKPTNSKLYKNLFNHCQKQYKDIVTITKAYLQNKQVFAIEYIKTNGVKSLASNILDCDTVINFE